MLFVIDKVHLHSSCRDGCDFNNQWMIHIINNKIHSRQSNYFMQLMTSFVNHSKSRHNTLISFPLSCTPCGSLRAASETSELGKNGLISCEIKRTFFFSMKLILVKRIQKYKKKFGFSV